jgi:D-arabinose 1-dehydrogenase-like Zn-dependent alcohol dehydrogenase
MPETALVAAMMGPRQPFKLIEYPVPEPERGAVLVKVALANICGSDLHLWHGTYKPSDTGRPNFRSVGHEMCGIVAKLGEGVTHDSAGQPLKVGDRVAYRYFIPCNRCRACLRKQTPRCPHGMRYRHPPDVWPHFNAAYGQYYYLHPGHTIFKIPPQVSDDLAAPANCALAQVIYGLDRAQASIGDHVVIQGAGGLGLVAVAAAKEKGVAQVIVIDALADRLQLATEFGADHIVDMKQYPTMADRVRRVRELTDGWGADIVLEVAGRPNAVPEGVELLGNGGTYVEIGNICEDETCTFSPASLVLGGKTMLGLMWYEAESLHKAITFLAMHHDRYPFHKLLAQHFPLTAINDAFAAQDAGKYSRVALEPWGK